jgi:hypothetical protein
MADIPPVTLDPRQQKIHEQLVRLGPGPAAFFRDACRFFQSLAPLESAGHFAGHCLRELKSSIKDVLLPRDVKTKTDAEVIAAIVAAFGLPHDHEVVKIWPDLDLARLAHRDVLNSPRSLDEVRGAWDAFQALLSVLLDAFDGAYIVVYDRLDQLLAKDKPGEKDLAELQGRIPNNPHTLSYFFGKVEGQGWFELLIGSTMFDDPPAGGYWPQVHYLRRVAADHPDQVALLLERIVATPNTLTIMTALDAVPLFNAAAAGRILLAGARSVMTLHGQDTYLAHDIAKRAATLAKDDPKAAIEVFTTLLALEAEAEEPQGGYRGARELSSPLEYYTYSDVVGEPLHEVIAAAPQQTFEQLLSLLDEALTSIYSASKPDDFSKGWMPAIESHAQNEYHYQALPRLAEALRDAASTLCTHDSTTLRTIVEALDAHGWQVLQRLALYLLERFGNPTDPFVQARVLARDVFFDRDLRHEYGAVLKKVYPALPDERKRELLDWIKAGPKNLPADISAEDEQYLRESWAWQRLSWLREHLSTEDAATLEALEKTHGVADERSEFSGYMSGGFWGPTSPKNEDELRTLAIPDLIAYLRDWKPSGEHLFARFAPTREGLARQLQPIVKTRALEFAAVAESFIGLDPTYVRVIVAGLEDAVKENVGIDWRSALVLCAWAVEQERAIPGRNEKGFDDDPDWSATWAAIARLLRSGFSAKDDATIPIALRETVWRVLAPITNDPDPDAEREQEDRDPYSVAINSTRGVAMEAVMRYAMWVRQGYWVPEGVTGFSDMPEVEEVVTRHLDPNVDASRAIRAVYGEFIFALFRMSSQWFTKHLDDLFPTDRPDLADAVLHAYLAWGRWMTPEFNAVMAPEFQRAIAAFPAVSADEEKTPAHVSNVGQRVVAMYMHGEIELTEDSLVGRFFALADEKTRAHVISLVPSFVDQADEGDKPKMLERAIAFWQWRFAASSDTDLRGFGRWMESDHFEAAWRLAQLGQVLERLGIVDMDYQIVGTLGGFAADFPAETLHCVRLLVGTGMDGMKVHALMYRGDLRKILRAALASDDDAVRKEATAFANELVARGFNQFRDVLDPNSQPPTDSDEE